MRTCVLGLSFAVAAALTAHCSLTTSPGDYSSQYLTPQIAETPSHVLVVAGQRDKLMASEGADVRASDVWTARIRADGSIVEWSAAPSAPLLENAGEAVPVGGNLYVPGLEASANYGDHLGISWIPLAGDALGTSWAVTFAEKSVHFGAAQVLLPRGLVTLGGSEVGGSGLNFFNDVWFSALNESQKTFSPRVDTGIKLVKARTNAEAFAYKNFVYVIGGLTSDESKSASVEVSVSGDQGLSPFEETTPLKDPGTGQPYQVENFTVCAADGSLYVIGGSPIGAPVDVVLMSRIDESNGKLGPWQATTKLPGGRAGAGCFVAHGKLYVLGGKGTTERSASVMWAPILPDGLLGAWDAQSSAPLPAARSQIAATVY